jgi:predicted dehydrogenase
MKTLKTGVTGVGFKGGAHGCMTVCQTVPGRKNRIYFEIGGTKGTIGFNSERPNELWVGRRDGNNEIIMKDPSLLYPEAISICDLNTALVEKVGDRLDVQKRFYRLEDVLADPAIDAVHLLTNIPDHDRQSAAVLEAGKHCACAVPMAITLEGIQKVITAQKKSGKIYMLMETVTYTRNYFYAQEMINTGMMGNIQFVKGAHWQDMEGWPKYWQGMPPMFYASHALGPAFSATKSRAKGVMYLGSGKMRENLYRQYGNKFPMENALYEMEDHIIVEISRTLFQCARGYTEAFTICGDNACFETGQRDTYVPVVHRYLDNGNFDPECVTTVGRATLEEQVDPPDRIDLLPRELVPVYPSPPGDQFDQSGGYIRIYQRDRRLSPPCGKRICPVRGGRKKTLFQPVPFRRSNRGVYLRA